ncbi:class I SAM-dependent methyltransferase [Novosphingobium sp. 1949]|uniref:Class I SAM-dependent methyltransferase n=1 Tax=Novosphingobium organovorum TaxID=2930092 RepID=A0ABT0BJ64_9SPHN|nr:methyltransferase domain-containing protein [Novosphingobium organovorum]MCJ2185059.1 class I SAM-dependent methyltransferase [Novosphingobium organovorum]
MANWFDQGGADYARFRPDYPAALAQELARLAPARRVALDVGCGNGQFTQALGAVFAAVIGIDPTAHAPTGARGRCGRQSGGKGC